MITKIGSKGSVMTPAKKDKSPVKIEKEKDAPETYTLRLPSELRKRVERLADSRRVSLNQQIIRILELHFMDVGELGDSLKSLSGRLFEVTGVVYEGHGERATLVDLQILEARSQNKIAALNFGVDTETIARLHVQKCDEEAAVQALARAVLCFYLRQGIEPEAISWSQYAGRGYTNTRILHSEEIPNGVATLEDFLIAINQDDWFDWFFVGNYLQDLNKRICDARDLSSSMELAEEVLNLTNLQHQSIGVEPNRREIEKELLCAIINITAHKAVVAKSQLRYMRALVNSPKNLVFEALGKEKFKELSYLNGANDATQSITFARVNQMLLTLAPQPVVPALSKQGSLGGFTF